MSITRLVETAEQLIAALITEEGKEINAGDVGLDKRIGKLVVVGNIYDGAVIATSSSKAISLDYYGGFEYIDDSSVVMFGRYKIYTTDASQVENVFNHLDGRESCDYCGEYCDGECDDAQAEGF